MRVVLAIGLMVVSMAVSAGADVFGDAAWLRDPVFDGVEIQNLYHKDKIPKESKPVPFGPQNVHTFFRKEIALSGRPVFARLLVTADDYCKLYINGEYVLQGPEPGYSFAHPYYEVDVTAWLREGGNCLAAHVYYQGLLNRVWNSGDNRSGFMLTLDVTYADGTAGRFVTDGTWRCYRCTAWPTDHTLGYETQYAEDIRMAEIPAGWRAAGFDDGAWQKPLIGRQDHVFTRSITPPLQIYRVDPALVKDKGNGNYFYDFGTEIVGHTRIRIRGEAGRVIDVRHGEELTAPDTVRWQMRTKCSYRELPVLSGGDDLIEFYDYKGFRYIEILDAPSEPEVWVDVRHHPFDPAAASLRASDTLLEDVWVLCANGVRFGSQGGFLDCPTREKGQYLGDALITGHSQLLLTGDASLLKNALQNFQYSQRICPGMMAVAPGSFMQEIAEYSLQWTLLLRTYYRLTGDAAFTLRMMDAAFDGLYGYFAKFETPDGLLAGMTEKWVLVDWPENLRDGYDYEYAETRENTVLNAFYYASLDAAADLLRTFGRDASAYQAKADRVKAAFAARLLDAETGLFTDAPGSKHHSLHANAIPLCFGLVAPENEPKVLDLIREKRLNCGVYIAAFVIEACFRAGDYALGYDLITSRDEHSWHEMLKNGATTCMEAWGPDQKWNTSWCHPWSSCPIFLTVEDVMGLTPAKPGWRAVRFAPRLPEGLGRIEVTVPTVRGVIAARYAKQDGFTLTVPPGT
ncbi:MAG: alpha-L-rhamnosidase, partial [Candidatus Hydrogenedentes bacterium]|nr:alpha-L-rhamnosidase [Candidatus Hydrogenedentota bacterium]